jgi:hypothetical protein
MKEKDKDNIDFLSTLGAPAKRALENNRILTVALLSKFTEADILKLHGIGPGSLPKLRKALADKGLNFAAKVTRAKGSKLTKDKKNA